MPDHEKMNETFTAIRFGPDNLRARDTFDGMVARIEAAEARERSLKDSTAELRDLRRKHQQLTAQHEALSRALVGDTGLSAIMVAQKLRDRVIECVDDEGEHLTWWGKGPLRCAECDCEKGGVHCNWIKPGPDGDEDQIDLSNDSKRMYEAGLVVAHSSDDSGLPDVGISVGLGDGLMLYAGEIPNPNSEGLVLYAQQESWIVSTEIDHEAARHLIEVLGPRIKPSAATAARAYGGTVVTPARKPGKAAWPMEDATTKWFDHFSGKVVTPFPTLEIDGLPFELQVMKFAEEPIIPTVFVGDGAAFWAGIDVAKPEEKKQAPDPDLAGLVKLEAINLMVGAAYEAASSKVYDLWMDGEPYCDVADAVRAMTPADAEAALEAAKKKARREALEEAAAHMERTDVNVRMLGTFVASEIRAMIEEGKA